MEMLLYLVASVIAATGLIVVAKFILNACIRKKTDYYEAAEIEQDDLMMEKIREANK